MGKRTYRVKIEVENQVEITSEEDEPQESVFNKKSLAGS